MGKSGKSKRDFLSLSIQKISFWIFGFSALLIANTLCAELPTKGHITHGDGSIHQVDKTLTIHQKSDRLITRWESFNIGRENQVVFQQPDRNSIALNRILGSSPTSILGSLQANGQVFLINPSGIVFGEGSKINVGGMIASSLNISDQNFLNSKLVFEAGPINNDVINHGSITTAQGGYIALLAPSTSNKGSILSPGGTAALAAGNKISLDFDGYSLVSISVDAGAFDAQVKNEGLITSPGGMVVMTAKAADKLLKSAVNNSGIIEATSLQERDGEIYLLAEGGETQVSGAISAVGENADGGRIVISGDQVHIQQGAVLDASGENGGEILVGGSWQNSDPAIYQARQTQIDAGATLNASGTEGNGGSIVAWSDITKADSSTNVHGELLATGSAAGLGGSIETSGFHLNVDNISVQAGDGGQWLIDPNNITITASTDYNISAGPPYYSTSDSAQISATTIEGQLNAGTSVTIQTASAGNNGQAGLITFETDISKSAGGDAELRLNADNTILMEGYSIISTSGALDVFFNSDRNDDGTGGIRVLTGSQITTNGGDFTAVGGSTGDAYAIGRDTEAGIKIQASTIETGGGAIFMKGQGTDAAGINIVSATINSGGGNITLDGIGTVDGNGIRFEDSFMYANGGNISFTGVGFKDAGIHFHSTTGDAANPGSELTTSGTGSITLTGSVADGGTNTNKHEGGIEFEPDINASGVVVQTEHGDITIHGTAGDYSPAPDETETAAGAFIRASIIQSTGNGSISITGYGATNSVAGAGGGRDGIIIENAIIQTGSGLGGTGAISLTGYGRGKGDGIWLKEDPTIISGSGGISMFGENLTGNERGMRLNGIVNAIGGDINLEGLGGDGTDLAGGSVGVELSVVTIQTLNSGDITISGSSQAADSGVDVTSSIVVAADALSVSGTGGTHGVNTDDISQLASLNSSVSLHGVSTASGNGLNLQDSTITANTGEITLQGSAVSGAGISAANDGLSVSSTSGNITLIADSIDLSGVANSIASNGTLTLKPESDDTLIHLGGNAGELNLLSAYFDGVNQVFSDGFNLIQIGENTNTGGIVQSAGVLFHDSVLLSQGAANISIENQLALSAGDSLSLSSNTGSTQTAPSLIIADELSLLGTGNHILNNGGNGLGNTVGTLSANTGAIDYRDQDGLIIGSVTNPLGTTTGITSTGTIKVVTNSDVATNDISITANVTTSDTSANAIFFNAGEVATAPQTTLITAGDFRADITTSGSPTISTGAGGRATFMTGSIAGSTSLADLTPTGNFRYGSDETTTNYDPVAAPLADGVYLIYREQPEMVVTADDYVSNYGDTHNPTEFKLVSGTIYNGDDLTGSLDAASIQTTAITTSNVGAYDLSILNLPAKNSLGYLTSGVPAAGAHTISPADLTITAIADSKTYDGAGYAGGNGVNYAGFVLGETEAVLGGTLGYAGSSQGAINVGNYDITPQGLTSTNYAITFTNGPLDITKAGLTIDANDANKTYDAAAYLQADAVTNGVNYTGFVDGEDESVLTGTLTYSGTGIGATNVGSYLVLPAGVTSDNYAITFTNGPLDITKAGLTIDANDANKTYDAAAYLQADAVANGVNYTGFVGGEDENVLTGTLTYSGTGIGATNVGSYLVLPAGVTSDNYAITFTNGPLDIAKAALTVTAIADNKTYNALAYTGGNGVNYLGFEGADDPSDLGGALGYVGSSQGAINVGNYIITPEGLTSDNYAITFTNGPLDITKAALAVTAIADGKTYNALAYTGGNGVNYVGFEGTDDATDLGGTLGYAGSSQGAINTGNYDITPEGLTSTNYEITFTDGPLDITKAALTVTAIADGKTYDAAAYNGGNGVNYVGFEGADDASDLGGALGYVGTSQGAINVGNYLITPEGLTSGNYDITFANGPLDITQAALAIIAIADGKTFDGLAYTGGNGVNYVGFVGGDDETGLGGTLGYAGNSQGAINVGNYDITPEGQTSANYDITFTNGQLNISQAALTIAAIADGKTYDAVAYAGGNDVTYTGFVGGDDETDLGGTLDYVGTSQGAINVGGYLITPEGLTSGNYDITFANGQLDISQAALAIIAIADGKTYDAAAYIGGNGVNYVGFVGGDDATDLGGTLGYAGSSQGAINVGNYDITPQGQTSANYDITFTDAQLDITQAALTITAIADGKTYDAAAYNGGNGVNYVGFEGTDDANDLGGTLDYTGTSQGAINVGDYLITPLGLTSGNYDISFVNGQLAITEVALTIAAIADGKTYDGLAYADGNGVTYTGFVPGEDETDLGGTLGYAGTSQGAINVGDYLITPEGLTSGNYDITFTDGQLAITEAALAIAAIADGKTYDGIAYADGNGVTYTGFVPGDDETDLGGTLDYAGTSQGAINVGDYLITPEGLTSGNYDITFTDAQLDITQAALTITAIADGKTYDGIAYADGNGVTYTGFVPGDDEADLGGTLDYAGTSQGAINVGDYLITPEGLTSTNYDITFTDGQLAITEVALTITAIADGKTYDAAAYNGGNGVNYVGFIAGEDETDLGGTLGYGGSSQGAINVGNYDITPQGLTSTNYDITFANGPLDISQAALTIAAIADGKTYDAAAYAGGNGVTYTGFVGGDDQTDLGGTLDYVGTSQGAIDVGNYIITPEGLTSGNYDITFANAQLDINQAPLFIFAFWDGKTYDSLAYTGGNGVLYAGFVGGEDETNLTGTLGYTGSSQGAIDAGNYLITPGGLSSTNYNIFFFNSRLNIAQAALAINATADGKTYDGAAYAGGNGVTYTGFVPGEDETDLGGTLAYAGTSQGAINVGDYLITPEGLTSDNYDITFTDGQLAITEVALTIAAIADGKIYDGIAYADGNGVTYTGFVPGDDETDLGGTLDYAGTSQGAINVGDYLITPLGLTSGNYDISFVNGQLEITEAALTIAAIADGKTYDGIAYADGNGVTYTGFVPSDDETDLGGTLDYAGTSQGAINVGDYLITPLGLTSGNYNISFVNGQLAITEAALTIAAIADGKIYDGLAYADGNGVTYTGFVPGDDETDLGGTLDYAGTSQGAINVGDYLITPLGLTSGNYDISFVNGQLEITEAALTIAAIADGKTYDGIAYADGNGVTYTGFVPSDDETDLGGTLDYAGTSQGAINVGDYLITPEGLISANYDISFIDGALVIDPTGLSITANDLTKDYDNTAFSGGNGVIYAGFVPGDSEADLGGGLTYGGTSQGAVDAGNYVITPGGLTSGNYTISFIDGALTVDLIPLLISANDFSKQYNNIPHTGGGGATYSGFAPGDSEADLGGSLAYGGSSQGAIELGSYDLIPSGQTSVNYTISYQDAILDIIPRDLSIVANHDLKLFNGREYTGGNGVQYFNFASGEGVADLNGSIVYDGTSQGARPPGLYSIIPSGQSSSNYNISYQNGALVILPFEYDKPPPSMFNLLSILPLPGNPPVTPALELPPVAPEEMPDKLAQSLGHIYASNNGDIPHEIRSSASTQNINKDLFVGIIEDEPAFFKKSDTESIIKQPMALQIYRKGERTLNTEKIAFFKPGGNKTLTSSAKAGPSPSEIFNSLHLILTINSTKQTFKVSLSDQGLIISPMSIEGSQALDENWSELIPDILYKSQPLLAGSPIEQIFLNL
jgi:filamentous hemagglutinin family protein